MAVPGANFAGKRVGSKGLSCAAEILVSSDAVDFQSKSLGMQHSVVVTIWILHVK